MKSTVAKYNAENLLKCRQGVSQEIKEQLIIRAREYNIILDDVCLYEIQFTNDFLNSIERK